MKLSFVFAIVSLLVVHSQAQTHEEAAGSVNYTMVRADLIELFTSSQEWWPADYGHYGPFFIRLAWHCSGSYRTSDGRGGCVGSNIRNEPELSWADNTNLDKARTLLQPIKDKYGIGLSWADLIVFTGNVAIEDMGFPDTLPFCYGRSDSDGSDSQELGPTPEQEAIAPCPIPGACEEPLGTTQIGLIYLEAEGPMHNLNPTESAAEIRDTFGRMGMDDRETVALIGGGHAFGRLHGPCPDGPGLPPISDPSNPWPGLCGSGIGNDVYTSGFHGPWTTNPVSWDNEYFQLLLDYQWELIESPGEKFQYAINQTAHNDTGIPKPPPAFPGGSTFLAMLVTDLALVYDTQYYAIVEEFANDQAALDFAFSEAWYKLTTRDVGPVTRCLFIDNEIEPARDFQYPQPTPGENFPDFGAVRRDIEDKLWGSTDGTPTCDESEQDDSNCYYGAWFATLAYNCASNYRVTDHIGGCDGARIRFSPESEWPENKDLDAVLVLLEDIYLSYRYANLSWADLIVLAGQVGVEHAGGPRTDFCGGRTDQEESVAAAESEHLESWEYTWNYIDYSTQLNDEFAKSGLTLEEYTVLFGRPRSEQHSIANGWAGTWMDDPAVFTNEYFVKLTQGNWTTDDGINYKDDNYQDVYFTGIDVALLERDAYLVLANRYATDADAFFETYAVAWEKLMNIDRFQGPFDNLCDTGASSRISSSMGYIVTILFFGLCFI